MSGVDVQQSVEENSNDTTREIFKMLKEYAEFAYEQEVRREESIKSQAANMQAAFSFMIAAVAMVIPIVVEHRGVLSLEYLFVVFSSILICLVASLLCATLALKLISNDFCSLISEQKDYFEQHIAELEDKNSRTDYIIGYYNKLQVSRRKATEKRIRYLNLSRWLFMGSLGLSGFWFVVSVIKLL